MKRVINLDDSDEGNSSTKENLDHELAKKLQREFSNKSPSSTGPKNIVDDNWELIDPNPDIHSLFITFNEAYFWSRLQGVEVRWSPRMTLCAGLCCYEGRGGLCSIRLSQPLLKLRPRRDLVQTLLHEMIHAFLFVIGNNKDHDAHGPEFHKHMNRINDATGTKITVYHSFHDEVNLYKVHWWRCNGSCRERKPYYGYVKRSMNRPPQPADSWYKDHQATCGGVFTKIKEPEPKRKNKDGESSGIKKKKTESSPPSNSKDIRSFFGGPTNKKITNSKIDTIANAAHLKKTNSKVSSEDNKTKSNYQKGSQTKMNGSSTVTGTSNTNSSYTQPGTVLQENNTSSNVFTLNSFKSTKSPIEKKKQLNIFSGSGHTLGSF